MYYFYSIHHSRTNVSILGISKHDPRSHEYFKTYRLPDNPTWLKHCQKHGRWNKKTGESLLVVKILHQSHDLKVIKDWRKYYYQCWNVKNNPKFIHSTTYSKRKRPLYGKNHPNYGKRYITGVKRKWYNDGYNTNIYVPEGTQPANFGPGRIIHKNIPSKQLKDISKRKIQLAKSKRCMGPDHTVYESIKKAAQAVGISDVAMGQRIKRGKGKDGHWKLI